ncbi:hypothetical protein P3T27_000800 [Kitasatospora sp. MAA19]|uniref:hypothetical protein n=2 Tax=unclassified Kitasatospora TaxID=2633591 RepID=UPI00247588D0|nr:hypothetical protein [Kitasatospora sp. MAA19]MDH6704099.1 hypothetical protein [Kitasatospora sp. MAA19]
MGGLMVVVPGSARWLAGLAASVCLLPLALAVVAFGLQGSILHVVALVGAVACAVPVCYRERGPFRVACAAAGTVVAVASVPLLFVSIWFVIGFGGWFLLADFVFLPIAAIPALVAAFQRARGPEYGRGAAALGWFVGVLSLLGWSLVTLYVVMGR